MLDERCPCCGAPTFIGQSKKFQLCASIVCPWFRTLHDGVEHFGRRGHS